MLMKFQLVAQTNLLHSIITVCLEFRPQGEQSVKREGDKINIFSQTSSKQHQFILEKV